MTHQTNNSALKTVNFTVGLALLVMVYPIGGKLPEKPAGVRTAIEMVSKKQSALISPIVNAKA